MSEKALKAIAKAIAELKSELLIKIDSSREDTIKSVSDSIGNIDTENKAISSRVDTLESKVHHFEGSISNNARICNLLINVVPPQKNEDLNKIFSVISSKVGYESAPEARLFRLRGNAARTIIANFPTEFHKNLFMQRYYKVAKTIHLDAISGARKDKETRIYIAYDLPQAQYEINKSALKYLKSGNVAMVRVVGGNIGIKFQPGDMKLSFFDDVKSFEEAVKDTNNNRN